MKKFTKNLIVMVLAMGLVLITGFAKYDATAIKSISTKDLQKDLTKKNWVVVDTRLNDAFNGWKLDGVKRGGHIKGATDFSAAWLKVNEKDTAQRLLSALKTKGITADKNVVLYDANGKDAIAVAEYLAKNGIKNVYSYDVKEWASNSKLPMETYKNYQMVVPATWINDLINNKKPETYNNTKYKLFEVSWGEEANSYKNGHIPGSVHIDTDEIEAPPLWSIKSNNELIQFAQNNGITLDTTIVLSGADPMASYRIAAILKYIGVKDVRVLNGGFNSWTREGFTVETDSHPKVAVKNIGTATPINKGYIVDINKAKQVLADKKGSALVDVRSWDEYIGKITGYSDLKFKGRPTGSVWGHAGSDPNHLEEYRNVDNTMRNENEILAMWKSQGITPNQKLCFMCGSGWRAAEVLIFADVMGLKNISLYSNGWYEWSADPKNPVSLGAPKK